MAYLILQRKIGEGVSLIWGVSSTILDDTTNFASELSTLSAVSISPDGTNMFLVGSGQDTIFQYTLSIPWEVSSSTYSLKNKNVSVDESTPYGITFKPDGTKVYIVGSLVSNAKITQYTLSIPWDISTASTPVQVYTNPNVLIPNGVKIKPDGTQMYISEDINTGGYVHQYSMSIPWDISTATFVHTENITSHQNAPRDLAIRPDGNKLFVVGQSGTVYQYLLSVPWDLSTLSFELASPNIVSNTLKGLDFASNGTKMYIAKPNSIDQYSI